jgi:hypothetical protein
MTRSWEVLPSVPLKSEGYVTKAFVGLAKEDIRSAAQHVSKLLSGGIRVPMTRSSFWLNENARTHLGLS